MSTSAFAWLDYSDAERRKMFEVIDIFREKGTIDDLGIGSIRDTFADRFFPAISTIQTRGRYFLFIPWLYRMLERDRIPSVRANQHARYLQARLVESLKAGGETTGGVLGIEAGANLQRPPSIAYWAGLRRLGILSFPGSIDPYHASLDAFYRDGRHGVRSDGEELIERAQHNWNPNIPPAPDDLLSQTTMRMRLEDADFLAEQIRHHVGDSLFAKCLSPAIRRVKTAGAIWDLGGLETLDEHLRRDIEYARLFALLMEGAALAYNLMLAEAAEFAGLRAQDSLTAQYRTSSGQWSDELIANEDQLHAWDRPEMWARLQILNPRLPQGAQHFSELWIAAAISAPRTVIDNAAIRQVIAARERRMKGGLARLHNERALERWSGQSGLGRLNYRWLPVGRQTVVDILDGLGQPPSDD